MDLRLPVAGTVIRYDYLWHREAIRGEDAGRKARPSAVLLVSDAGRVAVAPITHSAPVAGTVAIKLPDAIKRSLKLDDADSWIVIDEVNSFEWPGDDLAPMHDRGESTVIFGVLPPRFLSNVLDAVRENHRNGTLTFIRRD